MPDTPKTTSPQEAPTTSAPAELLRTPEEWGRSVYGVLGVTLPTDAHENRIGMVPPARRRAKPTAAPRPHPDAWQHHAALHSAAAAKQRGEKGFDADEKISKADYDAAIQRVAGMVIGGASAPVAPKK